MNSTGADGSAGRASRGYEPGSDANSGNIIVTEDRDQIMDGEPVASDVCADVDVKIVFPGDGIIRIERARLFADLHGFFYRRFVARVFLATEIDSVVIAHEGRGCHASG